jgi:hypothetical protein
VDNYSLRSQNAEWGRLAGELVTMCADRTRLLSPTAVSLIDNTQRGYGTKELQGNPLFAGEV